MVESHAADEVLGKNSSKIEQSIDDVVVNDSAVEAEEQCASNEEANEELTVVEHGIEVDEEELKRDKIIEEVIISSVTQPTEKLEDVENEIRQKFANIGVNILSMNSFTNSRGCFKQSRVRLTPVNLKTIWGRRLGLKNCSIIEYFPPPPGWKPSK